MKRENVMKKFICSVVIVFSLSLIVLVLDCTCENNAFSAEIEFPEELLSQTVEWETCELNEEQKGWRKAECADITVPLFWDNPEGETMTIRVKRLKSLFKATKQLWLLESGPGNAGTHTLHYMRIISQRDWRTDLYALDHRGTGYSNRLGCPDQEADSEKGYPISESEWPTCIDYMKDNYNLDALTVTQAAKDVGFIVELLREVNKEIFVYCLSYGTYWGHRYAQIFPDQADGVILDSVAPSVGLTFDQYDMRANNTVKDFFDICKEDDFCRSKMGGDPWGKANDTFDKFKEDGHCPEVAEHGLTLEILQLAGFNALRFWDLRIVLPALYYRLDRCNEKDVNALKYLLDGFLSQIFEASQITSTHHWESWALRYHIGLSEMISDNPMSADRAKEIDETLLASGHLSYKSLQLLEEGWPTYETDDYYHEWASQDVPILMLNGTLDHQSTIEVARIAKENLTGPNQYFIEVPNVGHVVYERSPVKTIFAPACGTQIIVDYMKDPLAEPDTSCLDDLKQIDFRGNPLMALGIFGTWNLWENGINAGLD